MATHKPATSTISTALVYVRVSSDEQAKEGVSLDAQLTACRRYAAERGWVLGREYQDILSGKRDDRPYYQALLTEVRRLRSEGKPWSWSSSAWTASAGGCWSASDAAKSSSTSASRCIACARARSTT